MIDWDLLILLIIGFFMGSFLAVVAFRLPRHEQFVFGRSHCDFCDHELKFYENIPVLSYIFLHGECRYCHHKISKFIIISEVLTGILFAFSYYLFGFSYDLIIALGIVALFIIVLITDIVYLIIPDSVLVFFSLYFIGCQILNIGIINTFMQVLNGMFLFLLMYFIMLLGNKVFGKESMGGADIKLMFIFGLILDPIMGCISIFIASALALPISIYLLKAKNERIIPFGPFLVSALLIIFFSKIDIMDIINFININYSIY